MVACIHVVADGCYGGRVQFSNGEKFPLIWVGFGLVIDL